MTAPSELLAKLEAAEGPSRELDVMIGTLFTRPGWEAAYILDPNAPKYTADQNAINDLVERVLPGCDWELGRYKRVAGYRASIWRDTPETGLTKSESCFHAPTAPLALCIALVKAKQAEASL